VLDEQVAMFVSVHNLGILKEGLRKAKKTHTGHLEIDLKFETGVPK